MRCIISIFLVITLAGPAAAYDLENFQENTKTTTHIGQNPGTPDGREGGEDMETAIFINALPFSDTGNTSDNINDYDAVCPYSGSLSPDVVYSFAPTTDMAISVDLCGSLYDTKTYVMDGNLNIIACNDDFYNDENCGQYTSYIEGVYLTSDTKYYIVIDGYGGDHGDYILNIHSYEPPLPCVITCDGLSENEPALGPDYEDAYNSGCGGSAFGMPFQELDGGSHGELVFCGISGWYDFQGSESRDTDWFTCIIGETGSIEWTLDAEQETYGFLLGPNNCNDVVVIESMACGPCDPYTLTIQGEPGEVIWLWVGPTEYSPPSGFVGYEYNYISTFSGLMVTVVATDRVSFDAIKSLYR